MMVTVHHTTIIPKLFILLMTSSSTSSYVDVIDTACIRPGTCYTMYNTNPGVNWNNALHQCSSRGQNLAAVVDDVIQNIMQRFQQVAFTSSGSHHAWVAGKRSSRNTWQDLTGVTSSLQLPTDDKGSDWCGIIHLNTTEGGIYDGHPCYDSGRIKALCETQEYEETTCVNNFGLHGYNLSGICHVVSEAPFLSWFEARQHCVRSYQGSLAYSVLSNHVIPDIQLEPDLRYDVTKLWIGLQRRPWVWIMNDTEMLMTYTDWFEQQGSMADEQCLHLDLQEASQWADKGCQEMCDYFVCDGPPTTPHVENTTPNKAGTSQARLTSFFATSSTVTNMASVQTLPMSRTSSPMNQDSTSSSKVTSKADMTSLATTRGSYPALDDDGTHPPYLILGVSVGILIFGSSFIAVVMWCTTKRKDDTPDEIELSKASPTSVNLRSNECTPDPSPRLSETGYDDEFHDEGTDSPSYRRYDCEQDVSLTNNSYLNLSEQSECSFVATTKE